MPFSELNIVPGVNVETSPADNPLGIQESTFIRWRANLPEKRGGCSLYINQQLSGVPTALKPWGSLQNENFLAIGTPSNVYTYNATTSTLFDISPLNQHEGLAEPTFTTGVGENYVQITEANSPALTAFDSIQFNTPVSVGGLILNAIYPLVSTSVGHSFVIDAGYPATSAVTDALGTLPRFETTAGLSRVIVEFPIQYQYDSLAVGDRIGFSVPTTVGGIEIYGQYVVAAILGATFFTFQANYQAVTSEQRYMNSGKVDLTYWITTPPGIPTP